MKYVYLVGCNLGGYRAYSNAAKAVHFLFRHQGPVWDDDDERVTSVQEAARRLRRGRSLSDTNPDASAEDQDWAYEAQRYPVH